MTQPTGRVVSINCDSGRALDLGLGLKPCKCGLIRTIAETRHQGQKRVCTDGMRLPRSPAGGNELSLRSASAWSTSGFSRCTVNGDYHESFVEGDCRMRWSSRPIPSLSCITCQATHWHTTMNTLRLVLGPLPVLVCWEAR